KGARRRAHEKQVQDMPHPRVEPELAGPDWQPFLDEELSRLPNKYRVPLILCDLEGRSRKEVARRLQIPEGTLSSRLATGRKKLAERLSRRGVGLPVAGLAAVLAQQASAGGVPPALVTLTVKAAMLATAGGATAGLLSAQVAALA